MSLSPLGLSEDLVQQLTSMGYEAWFPIQEEAIPNILQGKDILGIAPTGSGKTASFALPILEMSNSSNKVKNRHVRTLILVPTRELAQQLEEVFQSFTRKMKDAPKIMAVYGGVSINPQMMKMRGTDILIATTGRLLDLLDKNAVQLDTLQTLVIDEADKMLSMGFKQEMDSILRLLPGKKQNILFSATLKPEIDEIKNLLLDNPIVIQIASEDETNVDIDQSAYIVSEEDKGPFLRHLLTLENAERILIFTSAVRSADNLVVKLKKNGFDATALHSGKSQGSRTDSLTKFKNGKLKILVATDLASRGIDILDLNLVINYELPRSPKDYIHRIGRTGRANNKGKAITLFTIEEEPHFYIIQKKMGKRVKAVKAETIWNGSFKKS